MFINHFGFFRVIVHVIEYRILEKFLHQLKVLWNHWSNWQNIYYNNNHKKKVSSVPSMLIKKKKIKMPKKYEF